MSQDLVRLNVGGVEYTTSRATLGRYPESALAALATPSTPPTSGSSFLDQDGNLFQYVLNFLRNPHAALPTDVTKLTQLIVEAHTLRLPQLVEKIYKQHPDLRKQLQQQQQQQQQQVSGVPVVQMKPFYLEMVEDYKTSDFSYLSKGGMLTSSKLVTKRGVIHTRVTYISGKVGILKSLPTEINGRAVTYSVVKYNPNRHVPESAGPLVDLRSLGTQQDSALATVVVTDDNIRQPLADHLLESKWTLTHTNHSTREIGPDLSFTTFMRFEATCAVL